MFPFILGVVAFPILIVLEIILEHSEKHGLKGNNTYRVFLAVCLFVVMTGAVGGCTYFIRKYMDTGNFDLYW